MLIHCFCLSLDVLSILLGVCRNSIWIFLSRLIHSSGWPEIHFNQVQSSTGVGIIFKLRKKVDVVMGLKCNI